MPESILNGKRIAVVEDEVPLSTVLEIMLHELGCIQVASVRTLAEAMTLADGIDADAVLIDYRLKGEPSGPAAQRFLDRGIKVILTSGGDIAGLDDQLRKCAVIQKPFGLAHLERGLVRAFSS